MPFLDDQAGLTTSDIQRLIQVGMMIPYTGSGVPGGYLIPDGSAISRTLYPDLNALYSSQGYPFGSGNGTTTFNIPDLRSRSPMMIGTGVGLSARTMGQKTGEELHQLTTAELASHTHIQDAHTHLQNAHTHVQDAHTHTVNDSGHTHTQNSHNHTQDAHSHTISSSGTHQHALSAIRNGAYNNPWSFASTAAFQGSSTYETVTSNGTTQSSPQNNPLSSPNGDHNHGGATATTTATNQAATATNISNTTGITNANATATNQNTTATNQNTTATNQNTGSDTGHNTVHPVLCVNWILKY